MLEWAKAKVGKLLKLGHETETAETEGTAETAETAETIAASDPARVTGDCVLQSQGHVNKSRSES